MALFCFTLVFIFSFSNMYFANLLFYVLFLKQIVKEKGKIQLIRNSSALFFLLCFTLWVTLTTLIYSIVNNHMDVRIVIQYLFTLQYLFMIFLFRFNVHSFEKLISTFSVLFSIYIICVFGYLLLTIPGFDVKLFKDSLVADKLIPGWPNTTPIPLLISLWLSLKYKKNYILTMLFLTGLMLTTSRGAYLGIVLIFGYFVIKKVKMNKKLIVVLLVFGVVFVIFSNIWLSNNPYFIDRMLRFYDRSDIIKTTMAYVELNPIVGFGGNTIDQLQMIPIDHKPVKNWGHTHNWILEILLRYGLVGLLLFSGFLISLWLKIKDRDRKFMFALLVLLALFQTFMRDFVFLFYLYYLSVSSDNQVISSK